MSLQSATCQALTEIVRGFYGLLITTTRFRLAAVNFFLAIVGITQVSRIVMYRQSLKGLPPVVEEAKAEAKEGVEKVKEIVKS